MESSRTSLASRTSSRTHFEVLGLGLEASSPRKLACPRLEDSTIFWIVKILWSAWKIFLEIIFLWRSLEKFLWRPFFFFLESTCACVLGPWPRECLSSERLSLALASSLVSSTPPLMFNINSTFFFLIKWKVERKDTKDYYRKIFYKY